MVWYGMVCYAMRERLRPLRVGVPLLVDRLECLGLPWGGGGGERLTCQHQVLVGTTVTAALE